MEGCCYSDGAGPMGRRQLIEMKVHNLLIGLIYVNAAHYSSESVAYSVAWYCFGKGLFDLQHTLLFSNSLVCCCISVASVVQAHSDWLCALRLTYRYWLESATCKIWLVNGRQGKASLCCCLFLLLQCSVHMFHVNKPGVERSAAVFKSSEKLWHFVKTEQLVLIKSFVKSSVYIVKHLPLRLLLQDLSYNMTLVCCHRQTVFLYYFTIFTDHDFFFFYWINIFNQ